MIYICNLSKKEENIMYYHSIQSHPKPICKLVLRPDLTSFFNSQGLIVNCVHDFHFATIVLPQKTETKKGKAAPTSLKKLRLFD